MNDDEVVEDLDEDDEADGQANGDEKVEGGDIGDPFAALYSSYQAELAERTRKYGAYISARSFLTLNGISDMKYAMRYDYDKQNLPDGQSIYVIDLTKGEDGGEV